MGSPEPRRRRPVGGMARVVPPARREPRRCDLACADEPRDQREPRSTGHPRADARCSPSSTTSSSRSRGCGGSRRKSRGPSSSSSRRCALLLGRGFDSIARRDRAVRRESSATEEAELDRVLATVLFTDIVGSTETRGGARRSSRGRSSSSATTRRFGPARSLPGPEIDTAGDGFFATFDGPARADPLRAGDRCGRPAPSGSRSAPGCTRARSSRSARRSAASPSSSAPGSAPRPARRRSSSRRP